MSCLCVEPMCRTEVCVQQRGTESLLICYQKLIFRDDKLFWISVDKSWFRSDFHPTKIFEILERNGTTEIKSFGNFGSFMQIFQFFPQVLTPMQNGKFIFYPQFVGSNISEPISFIEVDEGRISQNSNDSVWSFINFPFDLSNETEQLWIFKLQIVC